MTVFAHLAREMRLHLGDGRGKPVEFVAPTDSERNRVRVGIERAKFEANERDSTNPVNQVDEE